MIHFKDCNTIELYYRTEWDQQNEMNRMRWTEQDEHMNRMRWTEHIGSAIIFEFCKNTLCTF